MGLQQGDISVREYEAKFNELSRFAPSLIVSEHIKCLKFERWFKGVIRKSLVALRHQVYSDLVVATNCVEQEHIAFLQSRETSGRTSGGPQRNNRRSYDQGEGSGGVPSSSSSSLGSGKSGPYSSKCHHCRELGHIKRNCPHRSGNQRPYNNGKGKGKTQGQIHTRVGGNFGAHAGNPVVEHMILISHSFARVLFDTGATHSFISTSFVKVLGLKPEDLETSMFMNSPLGCVEMTSICQSCVITIGSEKLRAELNVLPMNLFDVVLGMNWLSRYEAIVDCHRMRFTLTTGTSTIVTYQGGVNPITEEWLLKHSVRGRRNLASFLFTLDGESGIAGKNVEVLVVDEYTDVFPDELPSLPPD
ncbi:uncharacterized protein LOC112090879 [Morus notabilis]|uniref:uncharacterized protein LOC112090879 n=1 Tax=Morus notabilis TaxID=981085 RepID=UPI000CECE94C|nr:uncharacterized protein LOC112090879 [Morus notabilis]